MQKLRNCTIKGKLSSNDIFWLLLFLNYSFEVENTNALKYSLGLPENHTQFQTIMVAIHSNLQHHIPTQLIWDVIPTPPSTFPSEKTESHHKTWNKQITEIVVTTYYLLQHLFHWLYLSRTKCTLVKVCCLCSNLSDHGILHFIYKIRKLLVTEWYISCYHFQFMACTFIVT